VADAELGQVFILKRLNKTSHDWRTVEGGVIGAPAAAAAAGAAVFTASPNNNNAHDDR
jgi:hypothetical protein